MRHSCVIGALVMPARDCFDQTRTISTVTDTAGQPIRFKGVPFGMVVTS
jgi:hypothetical protein